MAFSKLFNFFQDDKLFQEALSRFQRALAKVLATGMVIVIIAATIQFISVIILEVSPARSPLIGQELERVLADVLGLLITIEVLENITAYLKDHKIQVELVLSTAITAMARKIIVLPADVSSKPLIVASLGVGTLALCASYWLIKHYRNPVRG
jgi:uncharacterized membrane protein (DUF373 family)